MENISFLFFLFFADEQSRSAEKFSLVMLPKGRITKYAWDLKEPRTKNSFIEII